MMGTERENQQKEANGPILQRDMSYVRARKRVKDLKAFHVHLAWFLIVIAFLAGLNFYDNRWEYPWFLWIALWWGIGLACHAVNVYRNPIFSKEWEERKIREFMEKDDF